LVLHLALFGYGHQMLTAGQNSIRYECGMTLIL